MRQAKDNLNGEICSGRGECWDGSPKGYCWFGHILVDRGEPDPSERGRSKWIDCPMCRSPEIQMAELIQELISNRGD